MIYIQLYFLQLSVLRLSSGRGRPAIFIDGGDKHLISLLFTLYGDMHGAYIFHFFPHTYINMRYGDMHDADDFPDELIQTTARFYNFVPNHLKIHDKFS